jgi:hypothetical protein
MPLFQKPFDGGTYDEAGCIRILFDRTQSLAERAAASESLYTGQMPTARTALLQLILDETEDSFLRGEAATTLGQIYSVVGVDPQALKQISAPYREEVLAEIPRK